MISKGLVIDEPWMSMILRGEKDWEMRSTKTAHRGWFGLIKKGSKTVVGVAKLVTVTGPYDNETLLDRFEHHRVGRHIIEREEYKWRKAWELADVIKLPEPVPYEHPPGAVSWVNLNRDTARAIDQQIRSA